MHLPMPGLCACGNAWVSLFVQGVKADLGTKHWFVLFGGFAMKS